VSEMMPSLATRTPVLTNVQVDRARAERSAGPGAQSLSRLPRSVLYSALSRFNASQTDAIQPRVNRPP
jgi:hypothetical protein